MTRKKPPGFKAPPAEARGFRPVQPVEEFKNSPGWTPPPSDPMREFRLAVGPYAGGPVGDQIRAAAIALDQCGLSEVADWVRSLTTTVEAQVEDQLAERSISKDLLEDLATDLQLLVFLSKKEKKEQKKGKIVTTQSGHPIHESWKRLCDATDVMGVDLPSASESDLPEMLEYVDPEALTAFVREACDSDDLKEAVRKAITGRSEGVLNLLNHDDVQKVLEEIVYQNTEEMDSYRKEVSVAFKDGALLDLLREGDVGDLIRRALLSEEWRTEALSAIAESFETKAW